MLRDYELTVVLRSGMEEEALGGIIDKLKGWITADGGNVVRVDHWGRRRLAYVIGKEREGYYVFMPIQIEPAQITRVERSIRLTEEILRHLFVRVEAEAKPKPEAETPA